MAGEDAAEPANEFVRALDRGLAVIRSFDATRRTQTLTEVAEATGLTRATARRFLHTLEALGYVRSDGRSFSLTPRVLELGFAYLSGLTLPELVQPHLERLSRELDESVSAAVLDGADIVYVARVAVRRIMSVAITIGTRFPAAHTSMGHVLTEGRDWAIADQELEPGLRAVAAAIHDREGRVIAAINVSTSTSRVTKAELLDRHLPALLATAAAIDADVAARG